MTSLFCPCCHVPIGDAELLEGRILLHADAHGEPCHGTNHRPRNQDELRKPFEAPLDVWLSDDVRLVHFPANSLAGRLMRQAEEERFANQLRREHPLGFEDLRGALCGR